jgi:hypothetical protein
MHALSTKLLRRREEQAAQLSAQVQHQEVTYQELIAEDEPNHTTDDAWLHQPAGLQFFEEDVAEAVASSVAVVRGVASAAAAAAAAAADDDDGEQR